MLPEPDKRGSTEVAGRMMQLVGEKLKEDHFHRYQRVLCGPHKPPILFRANLGYLSLPLTQRSKGDAQVVCCLSLGDLKEIHIQSLNVDIHPQM